ncbi:hypothetical protein ACUXCC_000534 [Cytobacillus horneckiae]|uniref:Uncharacterized protein n=1 Tax=Cytobacillus horneckiae TaxID=549687 RepID=A0A2N0ZCM3_9BACI|nr:hypothetical protein [Cytobacillus horneckiae]MBN6885394.1 hypothetical protein [Cytobacillus horneckiae]MEC1158813.1 hypothetical protein [Cytobacillus horneckiae]MED2937233.1 hypothetical protein [Cytobacillus horneckiae]PKG27263.1 hypothetical protein CWS20_19920 [Cytobacillus horneckiae]
MFNWLTEIEEPIIPFNEDNGELKIHKIENDKNLTHMSEVCQIFAALDVISEEDGMTAYPTSNHQATQLIMEEVVPHYEVVKEIFIDGELKEINVFRLKNNSRRIIEELLLEGVYPVIPDLYRSKSINRSNYPRRLKYYSINKELINQIYNKETDDVFSFFNSSFLAENQPLALQPTGWKLQSQLKDSYTIRAFSTFAKQLVLIVNDLDNGVIGLDIYN